MTTTSQTVPHIWDSRWFELMYIMSEKPDQYITRISCSVRIWPSHMYLTWFAYNNILLVVNSVGQILLLLRKIAPDSTSQLGWVAHRTRLSFSPNTIIKPVGLSQSSVDDMLLGLLGSYLQHTISTCNTCSRGSTHWSLIDTDGGYNLVGVIPNRRSFTFHLMVPLGLRLTNNQYQLNRRENKP
jgi:hypothetical protein